MKTIIFIAFGVCYVSHASAQLNIKPNARLNMSGASFVTTSGNVSTTTSILGAGTLVMNGSNTQQLNTNGNSVPNLNVQNPANIQLTGNTLINNRLHFISGKILTGNFYLALSGIGIITGAGPGRFVETTGNGQLKKLVTTAISNYLMPTGNGTNYTPVAISASGTFTNASVGVNNKAMVHPKKTAGTTSYLNTYWTLTRTGITGAVSGAATYTPANIAGTEAALKGYVWNGTSWSKIGAAINYTTNQVSAPIINSPSDIYAMNDMTASRVSGATGNDALLDSENAEGLFPNPASLNSSLYLNTADDGFATISIYDSKGSLVHAHQLYLRGGSNRYFIDLSAYKNGVFSVSVRSADGIKSFKLIKK